MRLLGIQIQVQASNIVQSWGNNNFITNSSTSGGCKTKPSDKMILDIYHCQPLPSLFAPSIGQPRVSSSSVLPPWPGGPRLPAGALVAGPEKYRCNLQDERSIGNSVAAKAQGHANAVKSQWSWLVLAQSSNSSENFFSDGYSHLCCI